MAPRRDGASSDPARQAVSDPLAELARLIGQDEAFGAIVRNSTRPEPQHELDPSPPPWRSRTEPASWQSRHEQPAAHDPYSYAQEEQSPTQVAYDPHPYDEAPVAEDAHHHQGYAQSAGHSEHDAGGEYYEEGAEGHDGEDGHYEGDEDYADPVPHRRRGVLVMAAAVIGLALVGTAGAFGYWAWSTGPRGEPPLIKADTTPNKVVPATQSDSAGNKSIYDRFSDRGSSERMVSREEAPAEIKSAPPRQVYPSAGGVYGPAAAAPPQASAPPPSGVSANGAPRVVHTETIRPNQIASADIGQPVAPPLTAAVTPPAAPPAPAAPVRQQAPRTRQALQSPAPQPADAPPAREAAATGGFVVQLSSQKTEEEARASFKVLASKYASVFGDREPYIKRVSIPEKGTFYRANVGPFATSAEANHFCSNLKIVGGQCIVQKN
ncbi:MAG: SPOR domain-containing protein [Hyphomicrobiales bacterium]|nr:SPOR domain-containing protein [Hyphomicrobiales bacterium]MBV8827060.1 SPOR domain-containing protein [Hyphomicrobiales bacterium]